MLIRDTHLNKARITKPAIKLTLTEFGNLAVTNNPKIGQPVEDYDKVLAQSKKLR